MNVSRSCAPSKKSLPFSSALSESRRRFLKVEVEKRSWFLNIRNAGARFVVSFLMGFHAMNARASARIRKNTFPFAEKKRFSKKKDVFENGGNEQRLFLKNVRY